MRYNYKCVNDKCNDKDKVVVVDKPMSESNRVELCSSCTEVLNRIYSISGIKTGDGIK